MTTTKIALIGHDRRYFLLLPPSVSGTASHELKESSFGVSFLESAMIAISPPGVTCEILRHSLPSPSSLISTFELEKITKTSRTGASEQKILIAKTLEVNYPHTLAPMRARRTSIDLDNDIAIAHVDISMPLFSFPKLKFEHIIVQCEASANVNERWFKSPIFSHLKRSKNRIIIFESKFLQELGMQINVNSSWEEFADCCRAVRQNSLPHDNLFLTDLMQLLHAPPDKTIIVIQGQANSAYIYREQDKDGELLYATSSDRYSPNSNGCMRGFASLLTVSAAEALLKGASPIEGIKCGLRRCAVLDRYGYAKLPDHTASNTFDPQWASNIINNVPLSSGPTHFSAPKEIYTVSVPAAPNHWSIMSVIAGDELRNISLKLVLNGEEAIQKQYKFPIIKFGDKLLSVDRQEFEGFWEVQSLMQAYAASKSQNNPLSIAVFGPPGSGKSFGVLEIARNSNLLGALDQPSVANLSQFTSVQELAMFFQKIRDIGLSKRIPLVLIDEFDTTWDNRVFGWLKYFLAPMQDGEFKDRDSTFNIGPAILIFLGSVNHSFDMLNGRMRNRDFIEAKGPDFVSRLRGHMNLLGIHQPADGRDDRMYIMRRALLLRQFLKKHQPDIIDSVGKANIDPKIVNGFLGVPSFKHGLRSLESLIRMCKVSPFEKRLHIGTLPTSEQMQIHVDFELFKEKMTSPTS